MPSLQSPSVVGSTSSFLICPRKAEGKGLSPEYHPTRGSPNEGRPTGVRGLGMGTRFPGPGGGVRRTGDEEALRSRFRKQAAARAI
jgi:hypothetical protein